MVRKLLILLILGIFLIFGGICFLALLDPVTQGNCDKIRIGMIEKEVESIFRRTADKVYYPFEESPFAVEKQWVGINGMISVCFDWHGVVQNKMFYYRPQRKWWRRGWGG